MNRLWVRLSLGFSGMVMLAVIIVACASIFISWIANNERENRSETFWNRMVDVYFDQQVDLANQLAAHYKTHPNWAEVTPLLAEAQKLLTERRGPWGIAFTLIDKDKTVIYHPKSREIGRFFHTVEPLQVVPIRVEDETVGYLAITVVFDWRRDHKKGPEDPIGFLMALSGVLMFVAIVVGGSGAIFGILMSRSLTAPLNNVAQAARALGSRDFSQRLEEIGTTEMIAVASAFNTMAIQLEQAEQLRRSLLADVAHELRTPLSVLQGNLRAILDEVYPLDQNEIARLYEQTRFLSRLVNDLHELAQAEAKKLPLDFQEIALKPLLESTIETFRPRAEADGVHLQCHTSNNLPNIHVDSARLRQVLQNLLANALRHTSAEGQITIQADTIPQAVQLSINDTGEGISPEHLPHIFDRFYRTDPARGRDKGGAGLGLAIVRAIVEAHGGTISAMSEVGQGTTFTIELPLTV